MDERGGVATVECEGMEDTQGEVRKDSHLSPAPVPHLQKQVMGFDSRINDPLHTGNRFVLLTFVALGNENMKNEKIHEKYHQRRLSVGKERVWSELEILLGVGG